MENDQSSEDFESALGEADIETNFPMTVPRRPVGRPKSSAKAKAKAETLVDLVTEKSVLVVCGMPWGGVPDAQVLAELSRRYLAFARMNPFTEAVLAERLDAERNPMARAGIARDWLRTWCVSHDFSTDRPGLRRAVEEVAAGYALAVGEALGISVRPGAELTYADLRALVISELEGASHGQLRTCEVAALADRLVGLGDVYRPTSIDMGATAAVPLDPLPPPAHDYAEYRRYVLGWATPPPGPVCMPAVSVREIVDMCVLMTKGRSAQFYSAHGAPTPGPLPIKRSRPVATPTPRLAVLVAAALAD